MRFSEDQIQRYSRNILLPEVGGAGQKMLLASRVVVMGAGGLGSPCALYLAAAGVGTIGLVDADRVELSNLQRQILHSTRDLDRPKTDSAREKLELLNPDVRVETYDERLTSQNILPIVAEYDVVVDGTDNFPARYLINDACVVSGKPLVHAGVLRFEGQALTIRPGESACYRCLYPEPPPPGLVPSCQEAGVLGAVAGVMGLIQATEALKLLLGKGEPLTDRLLLCDALGMTFRQVSVRRDPNCAVCGEHPTITELIDYEVFCGPVPNE